VAGVSDACESVGFEVIEASTSAFDTVHQQDQLLRDIAQAESFKEESSYKFTMFQIVNPCKKLQDDPAISLSVNCICNLTGTIY
jgi:hypothetical protein